MTLARQHRHFTYAAVWCHTCRFWWGHLAATQPSRSCVACLQRAAAVALETASCLLGIWRHASAAMWYYVWGISCRFIQITWAAEGPGPGSGTAGASAAAPQGWQIASQPGRTDATGASCWGGVRSCAGCGQLVQQDSVNSHAACVQPVELCMMHEEACGAAMQPFLQQHRVARAPRWA